MFPLYICPYCDFKFRTRTQAVEAESAVVKEVADVARLGGHGAEGVRAAGGEGVNADEQHVHQQGPRVAVAQEVQRGAEEAEVPQEVPAADETDSVTTYGNSASTHCRNRSFPVTTKLFCVVGRTTWAENGSRC